MATLTLNPEERTIFQSFSAELQNGWQIEEEKPIPELSPEERRTRLSLARIRDAQIAALVEKAKANASVDDLAAMMEQIDLADASDADLGELFFALGPQPLTVLIGSLLRSAKTDEDLADIEALTFIRHSLLI